MAKMNAKVNQSSLEDYRNALICAMDTQCPRCRYRLIRSLYMSECYEAPEFHDYLVVAYERSRDSLKWLIDHRQLKDFLCPKCLRALKLYALN